jgi:hypothetical protein
MSSKLTFKGSHVTFPPICVHCLQPAVSTYEIKRTVSRGKRNKTLRLNVPMCASHQTLAVARNRTEQRLGKIGLGLGAVVAVAVVLGLLSFWSLRSQSLQAANYVALAVLGAGAFLAAWKLMTEVIAPRYADPEAKAVRGAVRIIRFSALTNHLQVEIGNDLAAAAVAAANADNLLKQE